MPDSFFAKNSLKKVSGVHCRLHVRKAVYYLCLNIFLEIVSKGIQLLRKHPTAVRTVVVNPIIYRKVRKIKKNPLTNP